MIRTISLAVTLCLISIATSWILPPSSSNDRRAHLFGRTQRHGRESHHNSYDWRPANKRPPLFSAKTTTTTLFQDLRDPSVENSIGLNELHTLLRKAVEREDYMEAGRVSGILLKRLYPEDGDESSLDENEKRNRRRRLSWKGLGAAPWLIDRLDALNYTFPTTIQINSMEAVNAILNSTDDAVESSSLGERIDTTNNDMGIVISGTTGSGKSLAYLVPLLSTLSDSLFTRQRLRVGAEESVLGDDLLDRVAVVTSPMIRSSNRKQTGQPKKNGAIATGAAISSLGKSGNDVRSPLALIVVPSKELGVQTAMLLYQLVGGNIKDSPTRLSGKANSFKFKGPKGVRIGCVLDEDEASFGLKLQTDVAITTPEYLGKLVQDKDIDPSKLRVIVYDEADLALEQTDDKVLSAVFNDDAEAREYTRLTMLVGASVTESLGNLAVSSRILPTGRSFIATATRFAELISQTPTEEARLFSGEERKTASLKDLNLCLYPNLKHQRAIVNSSTGLLTLTRLLRKELSKYEENLSNGMSDKEIQRPRVVVFFPDEAQAKAAIEPLRDALWGEHRLCVLLPTIGERPLTIMDEFKRNATSVMLATPNSVRGLDFPALTHVYSLYMPMDDPREYVHLAGRVGRVGQLGSVLGDGGHVISILKEEDAPKMVDLAETLGFTFTDINTNLVEFDRTEDGSIDVEGADVEKMRRYLEDSLSLLTLEEDPEYRDRSESDVIDAEVIQDDVDTDDSDDEDEAFQ